MNSDIDQELGKVGKEVASLQIPPITRTTLALYAGASGDHNPMHIDLDFARKAGAEDVFAHGMLVMAYLGRLLTDRFGTKALRRWEARFVAVTSVGAELSCLATVAEPTETRESDSSQKIVRLNLIVRDSQGQTKLEGSAEIVW